jgi:hypothetical protein
MICFHQPDTSCATDSGDNGSVVSRRQIDQERRFGRIGRSKSTRFNGVLLRVFPIVVSADFCSVRIKQIESRISEHTPHSKAGERRAQRAEANRSVVTPVQNHSGNYDVIVTTHKASGADVEQARGRIEFVYFNQADADGIRLATNNRRVISRVL